MPKHHCALAKVMANWQASDMQREEDWAGKVEISKLCWEHTSTQGMRRMNDPE